jgi:mRNA-degrading endonuclease HigB of HigAB toxin-antitoxin module
VLIAAVFYSTGVVMIKFVGTHAEYTKMLTETGAAKVEPY